VNPVRHLGMVSATPTCPPPIPPAPLDPPPFAMTGTGDVVGWPALPSSPPERALEPVVELRVVPPRARSRAARTPFVLLVLALLGGGLVSLLLINTALSQGAFAVQSLQKANASLTEQQQQLGQSLADAGQPNALASRAVALGMVPGGAPAFLHLPDGKVLGIAKVAVALPSPTPSPSATPSASPSASASASPSASPSAASSAASTSAAPSSATTTPTKAPPTKATSTKGTP
jgi:hypothetical protein